MRKSLPHHSALCAIRLRSEPRGSVVDPWARSFERMARLAGPGKITPGRMRHGTGARGGNSGWEHRRASSVLAGAGLRLGRTTLSSIAAARRLTHRASRLDLCIGRTRSSNPRYSPIFRIGEWMGCPDACSRELARVVLRPIGTRRNRERARGYTGGRANSIHSGLKKCPRNSFPTAIPTSW